MGITSLPTVESVGYGGDIDEVAWARLAAHLGAEFGVVGEGDWRVTADTTGDKRVRVAAGTAYGAGVFDTLPELVTHTFDPVASGTRWDILYLRRSWSGGGGTTSLLSASATAGGDIPGTRQNTPGVLVDQPLALVQLTAGQTAPTQIIDLRAWQANGGATVAHEKALQYLTAPGTEVWVGDVLWVRRVNTSGVAEWQRTSLAAVPLAAVGEGLSGNPPAGAQFLMQSGTYATTPNADGSIVLQFATPFPAGLLSAQITAASGSANPLIVTLFSSAAGVLAFKPSRTRMAVRVFNADGTPVSMAQPVRLVYTAIGW